LRLSAKSASQSAVFFYHKKSASSIFSQPDQPNRTSSGATWSCIVVQLLFVPNISFRTARLLVLLKPELSDVLLEFDPSRFLFGQQTKFLQSENNVKVTF
jgi:hypothetical protein